MRSRRRRAVIEVDDAEQATFAGSGLATSSLPGTTPSPPPLWDWKGVSGTRRCHCRPPDAASRRRPDSESTAHSSYRAARRLRRRGVRAATTSAATLGWRNLIEGGRRRDSLDAALREAAACGALVSGHPAAKGRRQRSNHVRSHRRACANGTGSGSVSGARKAICPGQWESAADSQRSRANCGPFASSGPNFSKPSELGRQTVGTSAARPAQIATVIGRRPCLIASGTAGRFDRLLGHGHRPTAA